MAIKGVLEDAGKSAAVPHVVTSVLEHNSATRALNRLEKAGRIRVTRIKPNANGLLSADLVGNALRPETRLVVLTHCSNVLGAIQPISEIGALLSQRRAEGRTLFLVDAAQTAGVAPIDVEALNVDLLAFSGHKGLLGPTGTGILYVREGIDLTPWREGGTGDDSSLALHPGEMPLRLEAGTPNTVGICGLAAGIRSVQEKGVERILAHERGLTARIIDALADAPRVVLYGGRETANRAGVLSLNVTGMAPLVTALVLEESFGVAVRAGLHCAPDAHRWLGTFPEGAVRASPGPFTTEGEIDAFVAAVLEIANAK
jgi:selenocysteine lyase/cysteine desulfurase